MSNDEQLLTQITGNSGKDAEIKDTKIGEIVIGSVAVTMKYGKEPITRWVNLAVFDERGRDEQDDDLSPWQKRVLKTVKKGSKLAAEGIMKVRKVDGKTYYDMNVKRIGVVEWIPRGDNEASTARKAGSDDDGEGPSAW